MEAAAMNFAKPEMLWLLGVTAPLLAWFLVWAWRKRQALIRQFVQSRLLAQLTVGVSRWRQKARLVLLGLAALLILLALARPQLGFAWEEVRQRGLDIVVAVDTSRSMLAGDVAPNRLARAKLAALDLMKLARTDRLALAAFAGNAFLQCPLTLDDNAFQQSVNLLDVGLLPQGGTAIGQAIEVAMAALKDSGDNYKAMILITDGEDHDPGALEAATKAAGIGLKIFTVGVGTATGDRIRLTDDQGRTTYVLDEQGNPVVSKLNQDLLREIAQKTGGDFLPLAGADPMQTLYEARLAPMPKSDLSARLLRQYHERYQWPLALAIVLLAAELFLPQRRRVPRPEKPQPLANLGVDRAVTLLFVLLFIPDALASTRSALRAFQEGQFEESRREYERLLEKRPEDTRLRYNAGTAALRAGALQDATNQLEQATRSADPELLRGVYYNLGNAMFRLGERAGDPAQTITTWEQALGHYESALKLDPGDADAQFNRELVQRKIELLKQQLAQQQQQQQESKDQPSDKQEPSDQQQQQQQQQQSSESQQQQQEQQDASSQPRNEESKDGEQPQPQSEAGQDDAQQPKANERDESTKPEQPPEEKKGPSEPSKKDQPQPSTPQQSPSNQGSDTNSTSSAQSQVTMGQMTPEQARRLLEAARVEERAWSPAPPPRTSRNANRFLRDW